MDFSILILVVAVAAVAYFYWNQRKGSTPGDERKTPPAAPANTPVAGTTAATPSAGSPAAPARAMASEGATGGPAASYDEYRRVSPSNFVYGKLTCNRCGSNLIRVEGGAAGCMSCGASLYRV
jgi:hypothetical protein